ncbi:nuclear hormone receptor HR96-like [Tetranychus urticae]|uniref:Nuclear receptor domain-containing protein n=1 Tax=Tetranychus urticae TaxID=32264 RepID=T1L2X6_TETUR|nr:nuclear hormone receptor HR96-like [Tetranychus urticae]
MTQVAAEGNNRQKICRVCSDKAMGFNFNAITCESCKAFFRRNAFKGEKLRCPFNNDCIIDKSTRRFCQKCRLEKCLQVGMKREWILSEEQKKIKRAKIAENRMKRTDNPSDGQKEDRSKSLSSSKKDYSGRDPATPSSNFSCSSSSSSHFGDDNGASQCLYNFSGNLATSPFRDSSRKESSVHHSAALDPLPISNDQSKLITNKTPVDSVENLEARADKFARSTASAPHLLDSDLLHNSWISLITDPSANPVPTTSKPSLTTNLLGNHYNGLINYHVNVGDSSDTGRPATIPLMPNLRFHTQPGSRLEPVTDNRRDFDEREESWKIKVNHRILEANFVPIYLRNDKKDLNTLNEMEIDKLNELVQAFSAIDEPILDQSCAEDSGISDVIRFSDLAIRRLIKWCKKIQAFASLCLEDQMALLKAGCLEMLSMKASFNFNLDDESWQDAYTKNGLKLTIFRQASEKLYEAHRQFIRTFNQRWRTDHKVNLLLVAIVLFNPDRPNLLHPATVRLEHYTYIYLLRRYLETKSDSLCQARTDHYNLMMKIEDLRELHDKTVRLYSDAGPEVVGPLLIEILDLK